MNLYWTSDGKRVSQRTIDRRRSEAYREYYSGRPHPVCSGCGDTAQGTAHIVPQKRCKDIRKADFIWNPINLLPACHSCNSIIESYKSEEFRNLMCYEKVLLVTKLIDPERFSLITL